MVYYIVLLLFSTSLSISPTPCESVEYYVTPSSLPNTDCPQPCYTLDYYALNTTLLSNKENVSLLFLEGLHTLNQTLKISGVQKMSLTKFHSRSEITVICDNHRHIWFENITHLKISNLSIHEHFELSEYGGLTSTWLTFKVHTALLEHFIVQGFRLEVEGNIGLNRCLLNNSTVQIMCSKDTPNVATSLTLYNADIIDSRIESSSLCKNIKFTINGCTIDGYLGRNLRDYPVAITFDIGPEANLHVEIVHTWIYGQLSLTGRQENNNISLYIHRSEIRNSYFFYPRSAVNINVDDTARNNKVLGHITDSKLADIRLSLDVTFANIIELLLVNTSMHNNTYYDGALNVFSYLLTTVTEVYTKCSLENETVIIITIENCTFINNQRALLIEVESNARIRLEMLISDSIFYGNQNAIDFKNQASQTMISSRLLISLRNVTFESNFLQLFTSGVVRLLSVNMLNIQDCRFINNQGTAIESYNSGVTLAGDTLFSNNTSSRGGALFLYESFLYVAMNSNTSFFKNQAQEVGGAIYLKQRTYMPFDTYDSPPCFYQITSDSLMDSPKLNLNFKSNSAAGGGDDIYGGSHKGCRNSNYSDHTKIFHFQDKTLSSVTSDPTRVCLCNEQGTPQCANMEYIYRELPSHYPGEVFTVSAIVVGYDFGTVPGVVFSELVGNNENSSIEQNQRVQEIKNHRECKKLNFSIETPLTNVVHTIQLIVGQNAKEDFITNGEFWLSIHIREYINKKIISDFLQNHPVMIDIPLNNCPTGFTLTTTPPYICTCHPTLEDNGITVCIITNHTGWVYRSGTVWVSDSFSENETNTFVVHQYCPYDYCKPENISVDLKLPDIQCAFNHSGVLCGGCYGNLSLALGTSRCLPCDNRYVSLLIVFLFAGLALVFFIKVLDLTVAKGTINGLIFYANIVWANKSIIFPTTETLHPAQQILHTFIAWLNLDLGIETCFIDGLDAYWKTWLQFVFPLYVWSITGVVIIASHYSTRASKIFGNNSVPVLATLILLSYAKRLRTIITSLGFSLLNYPEGTRVVWSFDGNIPYFGAAHSILFLVALAALLLLWLPYTTVLLTLQWLRRKSYLKPLRWINRWKPFFDAYFGQLKPKHHYWVGLLLLVRVVLLEMIAATSAVVPKLNIITMVIIGLMLLVKQIYTGSIYKSLHLSILENSFIVNLTVLGVSKLYMLPNDPGHTPVVYTSIGVVFIEFLAIVIYHTWSRLKSTYLTYKRRHSEGEDTPTDRELRVVAAVPHNRMHYREPLLDSSVQER